MYAAAPVDSTDLQFHRLLETGSTQLIRNTAAQQLADVQKQHPDELFNLLGRVVRYLKSKSWDTRIAAAKAIGGIVDNAERFDPNADDGVVVKDEDDSVKKEEEDDDAEDGDVKVEENGNDADELLSPDTLDINAILKYGQKLLGSGGLEYDYALGTMNASERLAHQKQKLKGRLGLAGEYVEEDLINDTDFAPDSQHRIAAAPGLPRVDTSGSAFRRDSVQTPTAIASPHGSAVQTPIDESGLSKRQLNQLKRKNKQNARTGASKVQVVDLSIRRGSSDVQVPSTSVPHALKKEDSEDQNGTNTPDYFSLDRKGADDDSKLVSEFKGEEIPEKPVIQSEDETRGLEWPFERLCEFLMVDLFDQSWEIRHGAAIALREVLRVHGAGAGREHGKTRRQNNQLNQKWLDDLACRLCCVLMLDRFGDYNSDSMVAPIRETVGQTLGTLLIHAPTSSVISIYSILHRMVLQRDLDLKQPIWEVCQSGMIGLKYLVAVRNDLLLKDSGLMDGVVEAVMQGLANFDDDVRAVSAATLIPIAEEFVNLRPGAVNHLINIVWECLSNLQDDLSASTGSVMDLLAKLCGFPQVLEAMQQNAAQDPGQSFALLVPRLYPFLRHTITSVRSAVLRALSTFLHLKSAGTTAWVDGRALRLLFQNLIVERNQGVLKLSLQVWKDLVEVLASQGAQSFSEQISTHIQPLISLTLHPIGVSRFAIPYDASLFIRPSGAAYALSQSMQPPKRPSPGPNGEPTAKRRKKSEKKEDSKPMTHNVDGHVLMGDVDLVGADVLMRTKLHAAKALGQAMWAWSQSNDPTVEMHAQQIIEGLTSPYSSTQMFAAMIIEEHAHHANSGSAARLNEVFAPALKPIVEDSERPSFYNDIANYLQIARSQCRTLLDNFKDQAHVAPSKLPTLAVLVQGDLDAGPSAFSLADADKVVNADFERLKKGLTPAQRVTSIQILNESRSSAVNAINEARDVKERRDMRIRAAAAGALVTLQQLPKKPGHVIKGIMDSIKTEENFELQQRSGGAISALIQHYIAIDKRGPIGKIISNLVKFCCIDMSETPEFHRNLSQEKSILSLQKEEDRKDHPDAVTFEKEARAAKIMRRGAKNALEQLSAAFGDRLLVEVPNLKSLIEVPLRSALEGDLPESIRDPESDLGQEVIDGLSILRALTPTFHPGLYPWIVGLMPIIAKSLSSTLSVIRYAAAKCFATICSVITIEGMTMLVEKVLPGINNAVDVNCRQGVVECIYHLIAVMGDGILPYVIFLIVPILGRMSDSDNDIRLIATTTFATLVKLVPLEAGIPNPPGLSQELLKGRERERKFIAQMLDPKKVEPFEIPVAIKAELRSYQQDGVNWLAFLNRYHLHGILCDDMGLGKTLQTLCIVASDHHARAKEFSETQAHDMRELPSLIVCPPTLSGHWQQEIKQYAPFLSCLAYVGPSADRTSLRKELGKTDIVITSYEVCRNDIEYLAPHNWNYCVLDEGHLIKNPKAKTTVAVKRILSNHRLILSGTPIQNNVLELWSLFDFLMPGFLGTEKVFQDRFAKPIAASRFSKSSSKEQEAGALAIEALHKQVLPFLLRRLKEEVLDDLPPKIIQNYYCDLSDLQKSLFLDFTKKEQKTLSEKAGSTDREAKQHIFQALQYMRKLCNSPALVVKPEHKQYNAITRRLASQNTSLRDVAHAPKLTALRDLLVDCGIGVDPSTEGELDTSASYVSPHRALIFCQVKEMLDMVQNDVLKELLPSVQFLRLDGSVEATKRQNIVNQFNTDPSYDVLLLTTSVGGLGLNLTGADTVIFVEHDWNPQKDIQAMDRAHRIGQKKVVNVYRLITRGTLEEKILKYVSISFSILPFPFPPLTNLHSFHIVFTLVSYLRSKTPLTSLLRRSLQRFKIDVASTVVNQQNAGLGTMETDQILDLFNLGTDMDPSSSASAPGEASKTSTNGAGGLGPDGSGGNEIDMVDAEGNVREKGKKGWLDDIGELWDERQYAEEFELEGFLKSMKG